MRFVRKRLALAKTTFAMHAKMWNAQAKLSFLDTLFQAFYKKNGKHRVSHGGTAIVAPAQATCPFDPKTDVTGFYLELFLANRCNAVWMQVTRRIKVLIFSVYCQTGASSDQRIHEKNDDILQKIFAIASQFGDIPILIAGDFQENPFHYESIARAINFHHWHDPLSCIDSEGNVTRPLAYSLDGLFSGAGENCSSIDAILMNRVAFAALDHACVVEIMHVRHRPIKAVFQWHTITQEGFVLIKPAPLDTTNIPKPKHDVDLCPFTEPTRALWANTPQHDSTIESRWTAINDFCVEVLLNCGAKWGKGEKSRGKTPKFAPQKFCPGQLRTGSVYSFHLAKWTKALSKILELQMRLARTCVSPQDWHHTRATIRRTHALLFELRCPFLWHVNEPADGNYAYIYHHLKNKVQNDPPNLLEDESGNIITQPEVAITRMNQDWDEVFAANILREQPIKVLKVIWPYICNECHPIELPAVTAKDLFDTVQRRNPLAAPGLDGWRTSDVQAIPIAAYEPIAAFFNDLAATEHDIPAVLTTAKQMVLNKNGSAEPMRKRLITVLPIFLLAYSGTRFAQLKHWQQIAMPSQLQAGIQGRQMSTVSNMMKLHVDIAHATDDPIVGVKLDKAKCFDRIVPEYIAALFLAFGLPKNFVSFFTRMYRGLTRHVLQRVGCASTHDRTQWYRAGLLFIAAGN